MVKKTAFLEHQQGWSRCLVDVAAESREDGGLGLLQLLQEAGFASRPVVTFIVKRARPSTFDPLVDDVLDALSALCA